MSTMCSAQESQFQARLAPLPANFQTVKQITGQGHISATLNGNELTIEGTFEGLAKPATQCFLRRGALAIPGPAFVEISISRAQQGQISGTVTLDTELVSALHNHGIYLQIHSEAALEGNLRGWLLPVKK